MPSMPIGYFARVAIAFLIACTVLLNHATWNRCARIAQPVSSSLNRLAKLPIESIEIGQRVLSHNPQIHEDRCETSPEPPWHSWLQLSLAMPKEDGSTLFIEMLRSEDWVLAHLECVKETRRGPSPSSLVLGNPHPEDLGRWDAPWKSKGIPYRAIFLELAVGEMYQQLSGEAILGWTVALDLPELGIVGLADITDIGTGIEILEGPGNVVTATFKHTAGEVFDLYVGDAASNDTIGTTANHPFWSVDRQQYVQARELRLGEQLQTYSTTTKRVLAKVPRPGSEAVYNLEVYREHVYYVGQDSILVHNSANYDSAQTGVQQNAQDGAERERRVQEKLEAFFASASVQRERYLRTADGKRAIDPITKEGRRIDHAVIKDGKAKYLVETTSKTAPKDKQMEKEARIRANGGTFIRDKQTRKLIDVRSIITRIIRRR